MLVRIRGDSCSGTIPMGYGEGGKIPVTHISLGVYIHVCIYSSGTVLSFPSEEMERLIVAILLPCFGSLSGSTSKNVNC